MTMLEKSARTITSDELAHIKRVLEDYANEHNLR
jgi:hypothetical protein